MAIFSVTRYTTLRIRDDDISPLLSRQFIDTSYLTHDNMITVKEIHNALINALKVAYLLKQRGFVNYK